MELVLNTYGVHLSRDNEGFLLKKEDLSQRIPCVGIKTILVSKGASITSDAIMLAIEKEIDVIFLSKSGEPMGRVWSNKYGSISTIRKGQVEFSFSHDAIDWIKDILLRKIENQQSLLLLMTATDEQTSNSVNRAITKLEDYRNKIKLLDGEIVNDIAPTLRGWEGKAAATYFDAINLFIPPKYKFDTRSQQPAMDGVNAMLNYGYGMLYTKIEGAMIKAGIDPYVGIMHRDNYNRPVLAFDVIEVFRVWIDYVVFSLAAQNSISDDFFSVRDDGSYWLEQLGRRVIIQAVNDYLDEEVLFEGVNRKRITQLQIFCTNLAQIFKGYER